MIKASLTVTRLVNLFNSLPIIGCGEDIVIHLEDLKLLSEGDAETIKATLKPLEYKRFRRLVDDLNPVPIKESNPASKVAPPKPPKPPKPSAIANSSDSDHDLDDEYSAFLVHDSTDQSRRATTSETAKGPDGSFDVSAALDEHGYISEGM